MGGEDFSFIAQEVPSVFLALGSGEKSWTGLMEEFGPEVGPLDTTGESGYDLQRKFNTTTTPLPQPHCV